MRIAASLILVFHLLVVALVPNQHLYVHRASAGILLPYANLLGINTAWRYFAPDPAPPVYYEFDVTRPAAPGTGALRHEKVFLPELEDHELFREVYNRKVALKNIALNFPDLIRQVMVPRLVCTRFPDATDVAVDQISIRFPSLKEIQEGWALNNMENRRMDQLLSHEVCVPGDSK